MITPTPNPWASEPTSVSKLEMGKSYLLAIFATGTENPVRFFALSRPLSTAEYGIVAEAGLQEDKSILEVLTRRREPGRLYLTIAHTPPNDPKDMVMVFDTAENARFEIDTGA